MEKIPETQEMFSKLESAVSKLVERSITVNEEKLANHEILIKSLEEEHYSLDALISSHKSAVASLKTELESLETQGKPLPFNSLISLSNHLYSVHLGLEIRKPNTNTFQFIFTQLTIENTPHQLVLSRDSSSNYTCVTCEPEIPNLDSLIEVLNITQNLVSFIISVRLRFKSLY